MNCGLMVNICKDARVPVAEFARTNCTSSGQGRETSCHTSLSLFRLICKLFTTFRNSSNSFEQPCRAAFGMCSANAFSHVGIYECKCSHSERLSRIFFSTGSTAVSKTPICLNMFAGFFGCGLRERRYRLRQLSDTLRGPAEVPVGCDRQPP